MEIISLRIRTADEAYGRVLQTVLKRNYPGRGTDRQLGDRPESVR